MRKIFFDKDVSLTALKKKIIGVIGYGNQGRAQALNIRESGLQVIVGNRQDKYFKEAQQDGFSVLNISQVTQKADILIIGIPDEIQEQVYKKQIQPHIHSGQVLDFASSYGFRFKCIQPPKNVDVVMMSPRAMGITVRETFVLGKGVPAFIAVGQDFSGKAKSIALALAKSVGCTRVGVLECTFENESDVNLFGEQALWPILHQAILMSYEVLVEQGAPPELAAFELYASGEAGDIFRQMATEGMFKQMRHHSPTSQYGSLSRYETLPAQEIKKRMRRVLKGIRSGQFAKEWAREQATGYSFLKKLRKKGLSHPINKTEKRLRPLTPQ